MSICVHNFLRVSSHRIFAERTTTNHTQQLQYKTIIKMLRLASRSFAASLGGVAGRPTFDCVRRITTQQQEIDDELDADTPKQEMDDFTREFYDKRIKITEFQRFLLAAGSSVAALLDPRRHDMIACLGETTGKDALRRMLKIMQTSEEGRQILTEKPRINTKSVKLDELRNLPDDTFGHHYFKFLDDNVNICISSFHHIKFCFLYKKILLSSISKSHPTLVSRSDS